MLDDLERATSEMVGIKFLNKILKLIWGESIYEERQSLRYIGNDRRPV